MKLLTLNCHSWLEENQTEKLLHLAETIKEKGYDVIALQEVSQTIDEEMVYGNIRKDNFAFVMGDFNNDAFIKGEGYDYLLSKGLVDTYELAEIKDDGVTVQGEIGGWEGNVLNKRIDLILTNQSVPINYSKVIFNGKNKSVVSDHFGVEVKLYT